MASPPLAFGLHGKVFAAGGGEWLAGIFLVLFMFIATLPYFQLVIIKQTFPKSSLFYPWL